MKNIRVKYKMLLLIVSMIVIVLIAGFFAQQRMKTVGKNSISILETTIRNDYDQSIKEQVNNVISVLDTINKKYESGEYTLDQAKQLAAGIVRDMRYKEGGYFWIDTTEGVNVVLLGSKTEGTNRLETKDKNGFTMVKEMIQSAQKSDDGSYTDYYFPKEGQTVPMPKRSFTKLYKPFGWVVGTGNYTDYIDGIVSQREDELNADINHSILIFSIILVILLLITILIAIRISFDIAKSLKAAIDYFEPISNGDFTQTLPKKLTKRKDDFGKLGTKLNEMRENLRSLIKEVKESEFEISKAMTEMESSVKKQNIAVESVSATTEELAASMQETAATAENIVNTSMEIETVSKTIATRAQEGAEQASNIYKRATEVKSHTEEKSKNTKLVHSVIKESLEKALADVAVVEEIKGLSTAIMEITNKTNLLSLNASIEAARAGEAGRGFAVVADEIGTLAEKSKETVGEIQSIIDKVMESVNNLSSDSTKLLKFVATDVVDSFNSFGTVAENYSKDAVDIDSLVTEFSATSEELLASIQGVLSSIDAISKTTNEGAAGNTEIAERSSDIMQMSAIMEENLRACMNITDKLHENVQKFQID